MDVIEKDFALLVRHVLEHNVLTSQAFYGLAEHFVHFDKGFLEANAFLPSILQERVGVEDDVVVVVAVVIVKAR